MRFLTRKRVLIFAVIVYLGSVIFSVMVMEQRRVSLQFHTRDYPYFIEFAARVADPNLRDRMAMNGDGYNFLGMGGSESAIDIFQALHAEYFRYAYIGLYALFGKPWPLYLFFSAVFFLPVLYAALLPRRDGRWSHRTALLLILLYVLYPATFPSAVGDIRSRFLFAAAWVLLMLAVVNDRPFREKLVFFMLLLGIREEGILFGLLAAALNFFYTRDARARIRQTVVLLALVGLALALFLLFMHWNQYLRFTPESIPLPIPEALKLRLFSRRGLAVMALLGGLAAVLGFLAWRRWPERTRRIGLGMVHILSILIVSAPSITELRKWIAAEGSFTWGTPASFAGFLALPTPSLPAYMLIVLLVLLLETQRGRRRAVWAAVLAVLGVLFLAMTLSTFPKELRLYQREAAPARLVWEIKGSLDPYADGILVDYNTLQAFYDFNEVVVYQRLPLWIAHPESRFYPANKELLAEVVRERIRYAVITVESLEQVREVAQMAGMQVEQVAANQRYTALRFSPAAAWKDTSGALIGGNFGQSRALFLLPSPDSDDTINP